MTKNDIESNINNSCSCHSLAYILLTSACLSNGAQGKKISHYFCEDCINFQNGYTDYKNFEIGVLFHSDKDHIYKALDKDCSIHNNNQLDKDYINNKDSNKDNINNKDVNIEIIPLPYEVKLDKFCSVNDHCTTWISRPYFNEDWVVGTLTGLNDIPPCSPQK
jgi:hypothetical protein